MPAAAARALRPMATRTPLIAMTAVQALCKTAKKIPDHPSSFKRVENEPASAGLGSASPRVCSFAGFSGTERF